MLTLVLPQVMSFCEVYLSVIYIYDKTLKKSLFFSVPNLRCCEGFSLVLASGVYSLVVVCRLLIVVGDFSCCGSWGFGKQAWQLWRGLSSCSMRAQELWHTARELWFLSSVLAISGLRSCGSRVH